MNDSLSTRPAAHHGILKAISTLSTLFPSLLDLFPLHPLLRKPVAQTTTTSSAARRPNHNNTSLVSSSLSAAASRGWAEVGLEATGFRSCSWATELGLVGELLRGFLQNC
ncbi:hypothetical protein CsatB_017117 [Cannabis sativa]